MKELQSFLGMVNYYGKFVPAMATMSEPLNELRRTGKEWKWGRKQQEAIDQIKEKLSSSEVLVHYDPEKPLYLAADASDYGIGAVLFHKNESGKVGVMYGRKFILQTDHEPLKKIFGPKGEIPIVAARRLHRWSLILMNYDYEIEYCPTKEFGNADGLSRLPCPEEINIHKVGVEIHALQEEVLSSFPVTAEMISKETKKG